MLPLWSGEWGGGGVCVYGEQPLPQHPPAPPRQEGAENQQLSSLARPGAGLLAGFPEALSPKEEGEEEEEEEEGLLVLGVQRRTSDEALGSSGSEAKRQSSSFHGRACSGFPGVGWKGSRFDCRSCMQLVWLGPWLRPLRRPQDLPLSV